jgi:hypothetical protein
MKQALHFSATLGLPETVLQWCGLEASTMRFAETRLALVCQLSLEKLNSRYRLRSLNHCLKLANALLMMFPVTARELKRGSTA